MATTQAERMPHNILFQRLWEGNSIGKPSTKRKRDGCHNSKVVAHLVIYFAVSGFCVTQSR